MKEYSLCLLAKDVYRLSIRFQMATVDPSKLDALRTKIEQRKACEKKAFDTSMQLIDDAKVDEETLIHAVRMMRQYFLFISLLSSRLR